MYISLVIIFSPIVIKPTPPEANTQLFIYKKMQKNPCNSKEEPVSVLVLFCPCFILRLSSSAVSLGGTFDIRVSTRTILCVVYGRKKGLLKIVTAFQP